MSFSNEQSDYAMLPIWILSVEYKGEIYTYAINGQTGKSTGKLPMDKTKLILAGAGTFFGSQFLIFLASLLLSLL